MLTKTSFLITFCVVSIAFCDSIDDYYDDDQYVIYADRCRELSKHVIFNVFCIDSDQNKQKEEANSIPLMAEIDDEQAKCEEITIPMCLNIQYNHTQLPNVFQHKNQEEAGTIIQQFMPLIKMKCSSDLKLFLCSLFVPTCPKLLPPCRNTCNNARKGCEKFMSDFGLRWPEILDCDVFPPYNSSSINCLHT